MWTRPWLALFMLLGLLLQTHNALAKDYYELLQVMTCELSESHPLGT